MIFSQYEWQIFCEWQLFVQIDRINWERLFDQMYNGYVHWSLNQNIWTVCQETAGWRRTSGYPDGPAPMGTQCSMLVMCSTVLLKEQTLWASRILEECLLTVIAILCNFFCARPSSRKLVNFRTKLLSKAPNGDFSQYSLYIIHRMIFTIVLCSINK